MTKSPLESGYKVVTHNKDNIELQLSGDWVIGKVLPDLKNVVESLPTLQSSQPFAINGEMLGKWDSRLVSFILLLTEYLAKKNIELNISTLPSGVQSLIQLATSVPLRKDAIKKHYSPSFVEQVGSKTLNTLTEVEKFVNFMGETWLSFIRFTRGKACFRKQDFWLIIQQCGPDALPIITLISLLMGLILAFMGAIQLRLFGADIYVANLVAIGMSREMGAMMTAIIMAGRTGAAFAAKLGTMQVNEEIDAFKTMGIAAMDFLVLPRIFALILMMPILTLYSNVIGILGGLFVATGMMDISFVEYYLQTKQSITLVDWSTGIFKSTVYGLLIAVIGCMSGIQCGRNASAVGDATTQAVVRSIVIIIVTDAIFTLLFESMGI
ncbi:MAG: ABC transporter permease [Methylococcales bacterium]